MMDPSARVVALLETLRRRLSGGNFVARHRARPTDFTRQRQLTFPVVMLCTLQKTIKSLQRHLHELLDELAEGELFEPVTAGAFTHARAKLKHTAFIELNRECVLPAIYGAEPARPLHSWRGHRLLGIDSSTVRLPAHPDTFEQFTPVEVTNQLGHTGTRYPQGRISVVYDLLNRVGLDARLEPGSTAETALAIEQLTAAAPGDVLLNDRGFTGYTYLAWHYKRGLHFVARCSVSSFLAAQELFRKNRARRSVVVKLLVPPGEKTAHQTLGLPLELVVRFVSVRLSTGELEVLATSLLDEAKYPTSEFLELYHRRWGHETFYGVLKGHLALENFSGHTPEAVRQDFFAAWLLCNLESVLTASTENALQKDSSCHAYPKQVNRAVSFHALKHELLRLLYSKQPIEQVLAKLQAWFAGEPVSTRTQRKVPRPKFSWPRSYHFQRHIRKIVF
jgi:hypothetical protein